MLYQEFDKQGLSHFMTEKFWTITFIPPDHSGREYQLTPLRTEGDYEDFRHPGEIQWSNDLLLDYQRRDFTINAMYYFSLPKTSKAPLDFVQEGSSIDEHKLVKILQQEGYCFLADINLLILRDAKYLDQVFHQAKFDEDYLRYLVETQKSAYFRKESDFSSFSKEQFNSFRVLIDPSGGIDSFVSKKLQTVGMPDKRFWEDALRLVRALRIVNICNKRLLDLQEKDGLKVKLFDYDSETWESIQKNASLIQHVAKERIKDEITKVFIKGNPFGFIVLLNVSGLLQYLFPALEQTKGVVQPIRYHAFDVFTHILMTLKAVQDLNEDYLVRFAMLYHDVGKVAQYEAYEKAKNREEIRMIIGGPLNHRNSSPILMKQDFRALGFSNKEIETISWYIAEHHTPGEILNSNPDNREKKVRKLYSEKSFEMVDSLFDINIADRLWQCNPLQNSSDLTDSYELKQILRKLKEQEGQFKKSDLAINGKVIMEHFSLEPSPLIGELLQKAFDRVLVDIQTRNTEHELLSYVKSLLMNQGE